MRSRRPVATPRRAVALAAAILTVATAGTAVAASSVPAGAAHARAAAPMVGVPGTEFAAASAPTQRLSQPNGATFAAQLTPATEGGLFETAAGYSVARDEHGVWRYVSAWSKGHAVLTGTDATAPAPAGLAPHAGR